MSSTSISTSNHLSPLLTVNKHWIVYVMPFLLLLAGAFLISRTELPIRVVGGFIAGSSLIYMLSKAKIRISLTQDHLIIEEGLFKRKNESISVHDIYLGASTPNAIGRLIGADNFHTQKRETAQLQLVQANLAGGQLLASTLNAHLQTIPARDLNRIFELKEKGIISEQEYQVMKLGYVTQHYLA